MYFSRQAHFELNPCVFLAEGRQMPSAFRSAFETQAGPSNKLLPHQPPKKSRTLSAGTSEWSRLLAHSSCRRQTESRGSPEISHVFFCLRCYQDVSHCVSGPSPHSLQPISDCLFGAVFNLDLLLWRKSSSASVAVSC